jgi:hypothetical protein
LEAVSKSESEIPTILLPVTAQAGDRIGRYKLLEPIGEGGCGVVYVAEQDEPVRRRVALKVIKLGMPVNSGSPTRPFTPPSSNSSARPPT